MKFFNSWKRNHKRRTDRAGRSKSGRTGACRVMTAWILLFLMVGLGVCGAEGKEMSQTSDTGVNNMAWWQKVNAYEIYVNSFQDSDGDGYGDLNGIRQRLDHLEKLGVGAVWLTPVYESPMVDNGYDVADYYKINPQYGSMEDMDRLISEANEKGIRIVMDLVFNHTSDQCEWFQESAKAEENE